MVVVVRIDDVTLKGPAALGLIKRAPTFDKVFLEMLLCLDLTLVTFDGALETT